MKTTLYFIFVSLFLLNSVSQAQFRQEHLGTPMVNTTQSSPNSLSNWLDLSNFSMKHSVSVNYINAGGAGVSVSQYTNSMKYIFSDLLSARADVSMAYSPNSMNWRPGQTNFSGIYLNRAQIDYQPWKNVLFEIQYRNVPLGMYDYNNPFYYNRFNANPFGD